MRALAVAGIQSAPIAGDLTGTWQRFTDQVRAVKDLFPHVQLVVAPELFLAAEPPLLAAGGVGPDELAVPIPGPLTDELGRLARETGLWLVPGSLYERGAGGDIYNTAVVISPAGKLVARYRKIFPWQPYETTTPGHEFVTFDIEDIGRVGLAICYDGSFPEVVRQLAWLGAEVIVQPTLTSTRDRELELVCARANAWVNQVYVVNINAAAPSGVGQSVLVGPDGTVQQQAHTGDEVLVDVLDLDAVTRVRRYGSQGLNRPWQQLARHGAEIRLPMYDGTFQQPSWIPDVC